MPKTPRVRSARTKTPPDLIAAPAIAEATPDAALPPVPATELLTTESAETAPAMLAMESSDAPLAPVELVAAPVEESAPGPVAQAAAPVPAEIPVAASEPPRSIPPRQPRPEAGWRLVAWPALLAVSVTFAAVAGAATVSLLRPAPAQALPQQDAALTLAPLAESLARLSVEVAALHRTLDAGTADDKQSFAGVVQRLERLEGWESALAAKVARLPENREANVVSAETTGAIAPQRDATTREFAQRDAGVDGWTLRSAGGGKAIIEARGGGVFQVIPGARIPGLGLVQEITQQSGRWVVITTAGTIAAAAAPGRAQF